VFYLHTHSTLLWGFIPVPGLVEELVCGESRRASRSRVIGGMVPEPPFCVWDAVRSYLGVNLGDPESHPEVEDMIARVVAFASKASLAADYPGWVTSGATESNFLALYLAREEGRRTLVAYTSAHYSILKAAHMLGMNVVMVNAMGGYAADVAALEAALEENPGSIVALTSGTTETGYLDPVGEIARIVRRYDSVIHVDAAYAGAILASLGNPKARITLDSTVRTLAVDMHKIPEAPIGIGVLLAYKKDILEQLWFKAPYLPSGRQFGVLGTRPAAPLAAAAVIAERLEPHLDLLARRLMEAARRVYQELYETGMYSFPHEPETPVVCAVPRSLQALRRRLHSLGYRAYTCPSFRGVRLAVMPHTLGGVLEEWLRLLRAAM
jgi:tyrosine decarboxylase/aspartate 1-decarboxylase